MTGFRWVGGARLSGTKNLCEPWWRIGFQVGKTLLTKSREWVRYRIFLPANLRSKLAIPSIVVVGCEGTRCRPEVESRGFWTFLWCNRHARRTPPRSCRCFLKFLTNLRWIMTSLAAPIVSYSQKLALWLIRSRKHSEYLQSSANRCLLESLHMVLLIKHLQKYTYGWM